MNLNDWFEKGLTEDDYVSTLKKHRDGFLHIYNNFSIPEADSEFLTKLSEKDLRVVVIAEEWCGHCMLNIPLLLQLGEQANMPIRFLPRDENPELMDQYLTNGNRTIPIFIFIDSQGNEVVKWGPIAPEVRAFVTELRKDLPSKDAEDYEEKFEVVKKTTGKTFRTDETFWQAAYEDIKGTLNKL